jgi:hypothetical protein
MFDTIGDCKFLKVGTGGDGVLGLAPQSNDQDLQLYNFMDQLKANG